MSRGEKSSCARRGEAITTVIVWLMMGAIVNFAVAWGFAAVTADEMTYYFQDASPVVVTYRQGWPMRSLTSESGPTPAVLGNGSIPHPRPIIAGNWQLAQHPIWPGFAINTVFYAAILWLLLAAPFALRRRLRTKRGLCPKCAYPVGTNAVCTECGAQLPSPSR